MRTQSLLFALLSFFVALNAPSVGLSQDDEDFSEDEIEEVPVDEVPVEEPAPEDSSEKEAPPADEAPVEGDEEFADEEMGGGPEEASRPPPAGKGVIWGLVTDPKLKEPLLEAPVNVIGKKYSALTDFDGYYRLELPPGTYELRFFYELHKSLRVQGVRVGQGEVVRIDAELEPEEGAVETFEVEAQLERATMEGQIIERQRSAAVGDSVGRGEISKTPDSDAAQAAQRVVGASIVGGRFVYVRGLGERYTNASLNGFPLPSPEPDRAAVPLDLFPSLVLESLTIAKTFTPDLPGDFAGGSVLVETRTIPDELLFSVSLGLGYNSQSTFKDHLTYPASGTDWLGFDSGLRELPDNLPEGYALNAGVTKPDGSIVTSDELIGPGRELNTRMSVTKTATPPNHSGNVVFGNGWDLGKDSKLGVVASLNYSRSYFARTEILRQYQADKSSELGFGRRLDYEVERGGYEISWGAFGSVSYQLSPEHEFRLIGFRSQLADNEANVLQGIDDNTENTFAATQLVWVARALNYGQLSGSHDFPSLGAANVEWGLSLARATRVEPDRRDTVYVFNPTSSSWTFVNGPDSGAHFFADQYEDSLGGKLDWTQPILEGTRPTKLKFGGLFNLKDREFRVRRLSFGRVSGAPLEPRACDVEVYELSCPDRLFTDENVGPVLRVGEFTRDSDSYDATLDVYAAYLMADVSFARDLRVIVGERIEATRQTIDPVSPFFQESGARGANLIVTDPLPAVSVVYSPTEQSKFRAAVSRTIARPQLRELAPFLFADYFMGQNISGNPDLELTHINNYDLRFEHFPTLRETLAFSFFFKTFEDAIEPNVVPGSSTNTVVFRNTDSATLLGMELEARKSLEFIELKDFTLIANLTLARSRVSVEQTGQEFITSLSRPLVNQAPWVVNVSLDYENAIGTEARLLYNVNGATLVEVGTEGLPDAYRHSRHSVDFTISQKLGGLGLKLAVENILDAEHLVTQGEKATDDIIIRRYREGRVFNVGASYTF